MDVSGHMRHSASHPLFQWGAPPLASSQRLVSRPPAPISRDPRPWSSLFKAPVCSPDLRLDFFAPEVQVDQKIVVYEAIDSDELIEI
ncbi:hypothetical protein B296_00027328 [Ensete ventricosum]|uniref:Uncharacterized protein n=1 Tax=Ensete ventricosum TaxID=4639 RepID=A0A426ZGY2_ENSVE|nr:hypothetical protein B296_00027328 [Ensete ventricosum]